ncbi:hypothetical protein GCM10023093_06340 [Nemorincola caseinilytica]|uniref:KTSC domain-containing protein n=1 Tax=Nemorincola caseinilytica TaxID=2054315 RepID=A0ABP8N7Z5_9BACT
MRSYFSKAVGSGSTTGVRGYEYDEEGITVQFISGDVYHYTYASAGATHIEAMKQLADAQQGLSTYISQHKPRYSSKY